MHPFPVLVLLCIALQIRPLDAACFLEDTNSKCAACWRTTYSSPADKIGVTMLFECPSGITSEWEAGGLPEEMIEGRPYPVNFSIHVDRSAYSLYENEETKTLPHANLHSCIASRGACTPFVANTPGLATHTPAMAGYLDGNGYAKFASTVQLPADVYTIIAHSRFFVKQADASLPHTKYDVAVGVTREVKPRSALCAAGSVLDEETTQCRECPAGTYQKASECVPCAPGRYGPVEGLTACLPCAKGFAADAGMEECDSCPLNSQRSPGTPGISAKECECKYGFYSKHGAGQDCARCPTGAVCEGGNGRPVPLSGFWADENCKPEEECDKFDVFMPCNPESDCIGGPDFACAAGHSGRLCRGVEPGFNVIGGTWWYACHKHGGAWSNLAGILGIGLLWVGINRVASGDYDALDIALLYLQITGMIASYGLKWHENLESLNTVLSVVNFDVDFVAPMCIFPEMGWNAEHSFYTQLLLPFLFTAFSAAFLTLRHHFGKHAWSWNHIVVVSKRTTLSFVIIVYHTLCLKCFQVFRCVDFPDGNKYMLFAPEIQCWEQRHYLMVAVACIYIPLVIVGIPVYLLVVVRGGIRNALLHDDDFVHSFGFFYSRYDTEYKWWECALMLRRFSIALLSIMWPSMIQAALSIVFLLMFLLAHTHTRPFVSDLIDSLEVFTLAGSIFYALSGLMFYPSITPEAQGQICATKMLGGAMAPEECANEVWYKAAISYLLLAWTGLTLLFAVTVASFRIREIRLSSIAQTIITKMLVVAKHDAESTLDLQVVVAEAAAAPGGGGAAGEREEEESKGGGSTGSWLARPGDSYGAFMGERFQTSLNKVGLHYLLEGSRLLQWAKAIHLLPPNSREQAIEDFQTVNQLLFDLPWDVTHYGVGCMAQAMRHLCMLPRIEDFVTHCKPEERQGMAVFMHAYADFIADDESDAKISEQGLLLPDGKPVIVATLMVATHAQHKMMVRLMENVCVSSAMNKGQSHGLWRLPSDGAHLTRPRKSSIWNTATPVVRAKKRFGSNVVPKIGASIEEEEPGGAHDAHRGASADSEDCIRRQSSNGGCGRLVSPCRRDGIGRRTPSRTKSLSSGANDDTDIVRAMSYSAPDDEAQAGGKGAGSSEEPEICQPRRAGSTSLAEEGGGELAACPPHLRQRGIEIEATSSLTPLVLSAQAQPRQLSRHHADADADKSKAKYSPINAVPTLTADGASEHERGHDRDDSLLHGHDRDSLTDSNGTDTVDQQCGTGSSGPGCRVDSEYNLPGVSRGASAGVTHLRSRSAAGKEAAPSP